MIESSLIRIYDDCLIESLVAACVGVSAWLAFAMSIDVSPSVCPSLSVLLHPSQTTADSIGTTICALFRA